MPLPVVYHTNYVTPLPPEHRFPMPKFGVIYDIIRRDGFRDAVQFFEPEVPPDEWITLVHSRQYYDSLMDGTLSRKAVRKIGLPLSRELMLRTRTAVGGTILTAKLALEYGLACNTAGGTHHAFPEYGSGFCLLNDLAVTARVIQEEGLATNIMIIDLDVHQGDGTAAAFENFPSIYTFSMHCEANFPFVKVRSDLDVALEKGMHNAEYLDILNRYIPEIFEQFTPDLVLYDAGVDTHKEDRLGKLNLTDSGLRRRDELVIESCIQHQVPVACVIGGGYDEVFTLSQRHTILHRTASELFAKYLI
ncbi:MAG: histone deacetylase [Candidatus Marinimicrobia bacterium]|nr:histone deacetylase [Candidatus Neomarinimicrobiota bacterium]